jgi:hypothetical protein
MKTLEIKIACTAVTGLGFEVWQFWVYISSTDSVLPSRMTNLRSEIFVQW